jgi:cobalt-precorrin-5B (C1)-methyltransferase
VLTALAALQGIPAPQLAALHGAASVDAGLRELAAWDAATADRLRAAIAAAVEERSAAYLARYGQERLQVGALLFDRRRKPVATGPLGQRLLADLCQAPLPAPSEPEI